MELFNLLERALPEIGQTFNVSLNWIGELIRLLINGIGIVGVGIILFSLILKLIVLPCDIYQRVAMRKQNIKMEEQKERMDALKKMKNNKEISEDEHAVCEKDVDKLISESIEKIDKLSVEKEKDIMSV